MVCIEGEMDKTAVDSLSIPEYSSDLFVNREKEIEFIKQKAEALSTGNPVRERTIVFWGYKGTGRTWLLRRLEEVLPEVAGVKAQYLDFLDWKSSAPDQAVKEIVSHIEGQAAKWLGRAVAKPGGKQAGPGDWGGELPADVQDLLDQYVLALLLDHVYESDWDLLTLLEEHTLALFAVQPRVLLVMAGRGRAYHWKTPELRLYVEDYHLKPFDKSLTEEQLEKQKPDAVPRISEIHEMSQGHPLGNILLAARPTVAQAMKETVGGMLDSVPEEERLWLEALCILRAFDEERIPVLLAVHLDDSSIRKWRYKCVREARDRLLQTRMALWKEETGGWVVDEAIRPVLEKYLQKTKPEIWKRLHCAAYRLYKSWEQQYPDEEERWQREAEYHAQCLCDARYSPDECL